MWQLFVLNTQPLKKTISCSEFPCVFSFVDIDGSKNKGNVGRHEARIYVCKFKAAYIYSTQICTSGIERGELCLYEEVAG